MSESSKWDFFRGEETSAYLKTMFRLWDVCPAPYRAAVRRAVDNLDGHVPPEGASPEEAMAMVGLMGLLAKIPGARVGDEYRGNAHASIDRLATQFPREWA